MTTDSDLRDLLSSEAAGPPQPAPGWDDVMRRGRHRRRARRTQAAIVAGLAVAARGRRFVLVRSGPGASRPRRPPRSQAHRDSSVDIPEPDPPGSDIASARVQGAFVTLIIGGARRARPEAADVDPCDEYHPLVIESPTQVIIDVVDATVEEGSSWARLLGSSGQRSSWRSRWAERALIDGRRRRRSSAPVDGADQRRAALPDRAPRALRARRVGRVRGGRGTWTFSLDRAETATSTSPTATTADDGCDPVDVEVRGTAGRLCYDESDGRFELPWEEGGDGSPSPSSATSDPARGPRRSTTWSPWPRGSSASRTA